MAAIKVHSKGSYALGEGLKKGETSLKEYIVKPGFNPVPEMYATGKRWDDLIKSGKITIVSGSEEKMTDAAIVEEAKKIKAKELKEKINAFDLEKAKAFAEDNKIDLGSTNDLKEIKGIIFKHEKEKIDKN